MNARRIAVHITEHQLINAPRRRHETPDMAMARLVSRQLQDAGIPVITGEISGAILGVKSGRLIVSERPIQHCRVFAWEGAAA